MCDTLKNDYHLCEEIGRGRFGVVFRCFDRLSPSSSSLACKSIDRTLLSDDPTDLRCLDVEPKALLLLSGHPNILRLHRVYHEGQSLHLVTDLCDSPDLFRRISSSSPFSEPQSASILSQLVSAIAHCHHLGLAHRDIKPDNILFDSDDRLRLADFGSAEWFVVGGERRPMSGIVGTPYYVAPEVLMGRDYNEKVDIWSAGVILYMMLSGFPPFYGETEIEVFEAVLRGNLRFPPRVFRSISPEAKDLLKKMLCKDVSRRLSADQVLRHPWIVSGGETRSLTDLT